MTTCWPQISESRAPMVRAMMSVAPPAANGTITFTKRLGQAGDCACARCGANTEVRADAAESAAKRRRSSIKSSRAFQRSHGVFLGVLDRSLEHDLEKCEAISALRRLVRQL